MKSRRIFYFCYDHNNPTGGQKHTYQHVDILNRNGFDAYVVHSNPGVRLSWFENNTRIISRQELKSVYAPSRDILVLPEDLGLTISSIPGFKVVFDKNIYHGFRSLGLQANIVYPCCSSDVLAVLSVSEHNLAHLQFAYPDTEIIRVRCGVDENVFRHHDWREKGPYIATIRKAEAHLAAVFHTFQARASRDSGKRGGFEWLFIADQTEAEVAATLGRSLIFVFMSVDEGLARLPMEAMACGCITVGYGAGPLLEALPARCQFPYGQSIGLVSFLEQVISQYPNHLGSCDTLIAEGRAMAKAYSLARQEETVLSAWSRILTIADQRVTRD